MGEHICRFIEIAGGAYLAPGAVFALRAFSEILISQRSESLELFSVPHLGKALFIGIAQYDAVAAIAGVENALGIEVHTAFAYVAHLGFRGAAFGRSRDFVE